MNILSFLFFFKFKKKKKNKLGRGDILHIHKPTRKMEINPQRKDSIQQRKLLWK